MVKKKYSLKWNENKILNEQKKKKFSAYLL